MMHDDASFNQSSYTSPTNQTSLYSLSYSWTAQISSKHIGLYDDEVEAARAYDREARKRGWTTTNFDPDGTPGGARKPRALTTTFSSAEKQSDFRGVSWSIRDQR